MTYGPAMVPTRILWLSAGCPAPVKPHGPCPDACCYLCGLPLSIGARVQDVAGATFTNRDTVAVPYSNRVCLACTWCLEGRPPDTLRTWTIVHRTDGALPKSHAKAHRQIADTWQGSVKSTPDVVLDALLDPPAGPWLVAVAETGQIHTLPWTGVQTTRDRWSVRYERETVHGSPARLAAVLWHAATLRSAGFVRDDIATGDPNPSKLVKYGLNLWRRHSSALHPIRGSALLDLALLLLRQENADDLIRRCERLRPDGSRRRVAARGDAVRVDRHHPADGLVAEGEERPGDGRRPGGELSADGIDHGAQAPDRQLQLRQLALDL